MKRRELVKQQNHGLDALTHACCAGHMAGVRLLPDNRQPVLRKYGKLSDLQRAKMTEYEIRGAWGR